MEKSQKHKIDIDFFEFYYCTNCYFYDGYDMCCHKKNFGTLIDSKIELCKKLNLYKENKNDKK